MSAKIYDFEMKDIDGNMRSLSEFKGKVVLIVNVASKCGLTPQYKGLQELYEKYHDKGFEILGFPANNFLWQEPGSDSDIKSFCSLKYEVSFPMFSKIDVKGKAIHPLYKYLTTDAPHAGKVTWNFQKFLINREGEVVANIGPKTEPAEITSEIEKLL